MAGRKDLRDVREKLLAAQSRPVKLRVVASVVHHELTHADRSSMRGPEYLAALNRAASALAQVTDLYYVNDAGKLLRVPEEDMPGASFEDGGNLLRSAAGTLYRGLSVRRIDAIQGVEVLKKAHEALDG